MRDSVRVTSAKGGEGRPFRGRKKNKRRGGGAGEDAGTNALGANVKSKADG